MRTPSNICLQCCAVDANTSKWIVFERANDLPARTPNTRRFHPWYRLSPLVLNSIVSIGLTVEGNRGDSLEGFKEMNPRVKWILTPTAVSNVNGAAVFLLQHIPASIFGSIISIADIASNNPNNFWWWINSPRFNSGMEQQSMGVSYRRLNHKPSTDSKNSCVMSFHS